jgi:hypothetical protein
MLRRDFFKVLAAVSVSARALWGRQATGGNAETQAPSAWRLPARTVIPPIPAQVPDAFAVTQAKFFNAEQLATLRRLSELMMPARDPYPGAGDAGVPEFLDFLIGASPPDRQQMYQTGLNRLSDEARKDFGAPFPEISAEAADKLIRRGLTGWIDGFPPADPYMRFMSVAQQDIRMATMNSEAWNSATISAGERPRGSDFYWSPIDPDIQMYV